MPFFAAESDSGSWTYGFGQALRLGVSDGKGCLQWDGEIDVDVASDGGVRQGGL